MISLFYFVFKLLYNLVSFQAFQRIHKYDIDTRLMILLWRRKETQIDHTSFRWKRVCKYAWFHYSFSNRHSDTLQKINQMKLTFKISQELSVYHNVFW